LGLLNVNIALSPVKPAEFVVLKFSQKMQSE
jgi:phage tail sheath protein FI